MTDYKNKFNEPLFYFKNFTDAKNWAKNNIGEIITRSFDGNGFIAKNNNTYEENTKDTFDRGDIFEREFIGRVYKQDLEKALDLLISIEPSLESLSPDEEYRTNIKNNRVEIDKAELVLKEYAIQNQHKPLETMQEMYYSLVNSDKYRQSSVNQSVVCASLNRAWNGIGDWKI